MIKPAASPAVRGYVYLLRLGPHCKIGMSRNPATRAHNFNGLPYEPELLHTIPTANPRRVEEELQDRFTGKHVRGEWFLLDDDDITAICEVGFVRAPDGLPPALRASPDQVGATRTRKHVNSQKKRATSLALRRGEQRERRAADPDAYQSPWYGDKLRQLRVGAGLRRGDLAEQCGLSYGTIERMERRTWLEPGRIPLSEVRAVAKVLDVDPAIFSIPPTIGDWDQWKARLQRELIAHLGIDRGAHSRGRPQPPRKKNAG